MVNEEDHLRIQVIGAGMCAAACLEDAKRLDTLLDESLGFAFEDVYKRQVYGLASLVILGVSGSAFTFQTFLAGAFITAWPGIICHIILIPLLVIDVYKRQIQHQKLCGRRA